jgi:transposase InsO family protein
MEEIKYMFDVRNLGRKLRKFIAFFYMCQRCKHPNRSFTFEERHHLPKKPGDVCAIDIYESLPTSRGGVCYILVCHDVFSRFIKLYPLRSVTTKACLNKMINKYFGDVIKPKCIFSDNATQFRSPSWSRQLQQQDLKFGLLLSDILSRTPASSVCVNCPNFAGFTAMRITGSGLNYYHI